MKRCLALLLCPGGECTGWLKGGQRAWMVLDSSGKPKGKRGIKPGVPVWGFTAA